MFTIVICDADPAAADTFRRTVSHVLKQLKQPHSIACSSDSDALLKVLLKYPERYNFLFLAEEFAPLDGISLARRLRRARYRGNIAITAADTRHVLDGYDVDACQYLLQPVSEDALSRLFTRLLLRERAASPFLLLNSGATFRKLRYADISYIETAGRKVAIHLQKGGDPIIHPCKLSEIEQLLPSDLFIRCHQSFLLQFYAIREISQSFAVLLDDSHIPVSRSYRSAVLEFFQNDRPPR